MGPFSIFMGEKRFPSFAVMQYIPSKETYKLMRTVIGTRIHEHSFVKN